MQLPGKKGARFITQELVGDYLFGSKANQRLIPR